jgi:type IV pilus assembly protein PilF
MRRLLLLALPILFPVLMAGCGSPPVEDTGTMIGEVSDPRNRAKLRTELASLYYSNGKLGVALEELRNATNADASYAPAYGMYGLVYMQMKDNKRAEESFERALRLAPNDADINHNYAWFLCQTERESESIKYFLTALRNPLYATPWRSYAAAGVCSLKVKQVKDAEAFFERALKFEPDEPDALLGLGQIRYRQGSIGEARRLVARYNKVNAPSAESLWLAVRVERRLGERVAEQSFANQLRRRYPDSAEYQSLQRGQYD